jgi:hypothetical protein
VHLLEYLEDVDLVRLHALLGLLLALLIGAALLGRWQPLLRLGLLLALGSLLGLGLRVLLLGRLLLRLRRHHGRIGVRWTGGFRKLARRMEEVVASVSDDAMGESRGETRGKYIKLRRER